jgi:DNA-binding transcriptional LysR family regulator
VVILRVVQTLNELAGEDLNALLALAVLHEERSVTRAARRLGVTQSAMSHTLAKLRHRFDDPLFVRVGRTMQPTERADGLASGVRTGLGELLRAMREPTGFDPATTERVVRLGSMDLFDRVVLPRMLATLRVEAPGLVLAVSGLGPDVAARLEDGRLDFAVLPVLDDGAPPPTGPLRRTTLLRDGWTVFVRRGHPAADALAHDVEAWCAAAHLLVSPGGGGEGVVDRALAAAGRSRRVAVRLPAFGAALSLVEATDLVLTAPESLRRAMPASVIALPPPLPLPPHRITLVWSERQHHEPGSRWFRQRLKEAAQPLSA